MFCVVTVPSIKAIDNRRHFEDLSYILHYFLILLISTLIEIFCEIEVQWVNKTYQSADPLAKNGASEVHLVDVLYCGQLWYGRITKICNRIQRLCIYFMKIVMYQPDQTTTSFC